MKKRLLQLAVEWKRRATELRALRPQQMQAAGISPRTRDYAVVHYED